MAVNLKKYDFPQVLKSVFDDDANTLRVSIISGGGGGGAIEVLINHVDDSIRLGDGTTLFTGSTVGPKTGLDVNLINDINTRDLVFATDKVDVTGSTVALDATSLAALENITVTVGNEIEISNDAGNPVPVNGTVTANLGTLNGAATSINQTTTNTTLSTILTELQQKTEPTDTQLVSAASLPLPSGASTSALQSTGNASLASIDTKLTSPIAVTGPLTDAQLRASVVPVSLTSTTISNFPAVQPVSDNGGSLTVDGTVDLGATSLAALENITVAVSGAIDLSVGTLAALENISIDNFPANQNVTVISSALPTGAATSANQTTANASLSSIDTKLTSPLTVQSTNLDIRDLTHISDSVKIGDGVNEVTTTKAAVGNVVGLDTVGKNSVFTKPYNQVTVLTRNIDGDILTVRTRYSGMDVQLATIIYDGDGDFQDVQVSDL